MLNHVCAQGVGLRVRGIKIGDITMAGEIALTSSTRANLNSLLETNRLMDRTSIRLSTGRDVNTVFDDPVNFVASQRLNDRANDLNRIIDGIAQNLRTVEAAVNGTDALVTLLDQAQSIADSAFTAINDVTTASARATGDQDLQDVDDFFTDLPSLAGIGGNARIQISLTDQETNTPLIVPGAVAPQVEGNVDIVAGDSIEQLVTFIDDMNDTLIQNGLAQEPSLFVEINELGQFTIQSLVQNSTLNLNFIADTAAPDDDSGNLAFASEMGFSSIVQTVAETGAANNNNDVSVTLTTLGVLETPALFTDTDGIGAGATVTRAARASDLLSNLLVNATSAVGNAVVTNAANAEIFVSIDGDPINIGATVNFPANGASIQDFIDAINNDPAVINKVRFEFDDSTSQLRARTLDPEVQTIQIGVESLNGAATDLRFGFGSNATLTTDGANVNDLAVENIRFGAAAGELLELETQFNSLRTQINQLVTDSDYRGVNILNGDDMTTFFNETRTSFLVTNSVQFTVEQDLNLDIANFGSVTSIERFLADIRNARGEVRAFSATLTNDLNVISTRESFTARTINTLEAGSDDLTLANEETESARMLALQTRQQLGLTSLSLASQAQQGILRLF